MSKSYIEVEAFISSEQEIYCKDCRRRKGIKNGKEQFIYEIGDAPCKACGIMDILDDVEAYSEAFPADVKPVVRCKECKHYRDKVQTYLGDAILHEYCTITGLPITSDFYCANGEKRANCGADMKEEEDE